MESVTTSLSSIKRLAASEDRPFAGTSNEDLVLAMGPLLENLPKGLFELPLRSKDLVMAMDPAKKARRFSNNSKQGKKLDLALTTLIAEAGEDVDIVIEYAEELKGRIKGELQALPEHLSLLDLLQVSANYDIGDEERPFGGAPDDMLLTRLLKDPKDIEVILEQDANFDQLERIGEALGDMLEDAYKKDESFGNLLQAFIEETMGRLDNSRNRLGEFKNEVNDKSVEVITMESPKSSPTRVGAQQVAPISQEQAA